MAATPSSLPRYVYTKLANDNSLRLLRLRSAAAIQDAVECELFESQLVDTDQFEKGVRDEDYEAVSWCWGDKKRDRPLRVHVGELAYSFLISPDLEAALRALRYEEKTRLLWVDQICINQDKTKERNEQVPKMNQIYGQAKNVCIWVGEPDETSHQAIEFIENKVLKLWDFDTLCEDTKMSEKWLAVSTLMKRPWFSRRWVVQEIALADRGILYCGKDKIDWQDFTDAVSLFVEAESVTHKLSNIMRQDKKFYQIPDFYGNVPALGAARLVDATSNLFRSSKNGKREHRDRILSLEYLVSKYTVFEAREPRDTIYALLAIARDTTPHAIQQDLPDALKNLSKEVQQRLGRWFQPKFVSEKYPVNYDAPPIEIYKDFIAFSISKSEAKCALNIICRPWAPPLKDNGYGASMPGSTEAPNGVPAGPSGSQTSDLYRASLPSWIPDLGGAPFVMQLHPNAAAGQRMDRSNADPLVGMPGDKGYSAAGTRPISIDKLKWVNKGRYYSMFVEGFVFDSIAQREEVSRQGLISPKWLKLAKWENTNNEPPEEFWRTLVADRGPDGQNTKPFYPRACKEAMTRKALDRGVLDIKAVIEHGRSSIIAEFLRRVQAVIWNRRLIRTESGRLGLVHEESGEVDRICILYGCSVPVVLRRVEKSSRDLDAERAEARAEQKRKKDESFLKVRAVLNARKKASGTLKDIWTDPTFMRMLWISALVIFAEYRHGFTLQASILLNSLLLVLPQPLEKIKRSIGRQAWKEVRRWLFALRVLCFGYLVSHITSWIDHPVEHACTLATLVMLLPFLFLSEQQRQRVRHDFNRIVFALPFVPGDMVRLKPANVKAGATNGNKANGETSGKRHAGVYRIVKKVAQTSYELDIPEERSSVHKVFNLDEFEKVRDYAYVLRGNWMYDILKKVVRYFRAAPEESQPVELPEPDPYYWQLIGECYVDGMMDGEAITYQNEKRATIKPQIFELR
jgi:hypothetical protein